MKICPSCQASFPDGFRYCPNDSDELTTDEEYVLRPQTVVQPSVAGVASLAGQFRARAVTHSPFPLPDFNYGLSNGKADQERTQVSSIDTQVSSIQEDSAVSEMSFELHEPGWLITRLAAAIRQFIASFGRGAPPAPPASAQEEAVTSDISFELPDPGSLITRLAAAIQEFINGAGWNTAPPAPEDSADSEIGFSIPEPGNLIVRLNSAVREFARDFGKGAMHVRLDEMGEFRFLLKDEPLTARLKRELSAAAIDFKHNPRGFLVGILCGEGSDRRRRQLLQSGLAIAVIVYSFLFSSLLLIGYYSSLERAEVARKEDLTVVARLTDVPRVDTKVESAPKETPKGKGGFTGGSKPKIEQAHGGGGGGRNQPTPPSKRVPPPMALTPQIVLPNPEPPKIKNPILPVPMTVYGDPKALPQLKGPIGDPQGVERPPSSGPGKGAGIGTGEGTGVGPGQGGVGPGRGGNAGGGDFALGGGRGPGGSGGIEVAGQNGVTVPTILFKEKAKYTEEARQHKIQGSVILSAIFTADGRVTNIRVARGLPDGLTEKSIEAAMKIRFQPATKNGSPVSVRVTLEYNFALY